ncbi:extracellular solute-binding protein [Rugosimonospora africana]|uniref:ABC transporter substrate-binding protein n=1 Tax=Rugosimonospora africana TaxID=556532 RepID=A0A8J3VPW8_9ACTN|nr:extracellular solute-binding protein [Rugosimonospora africana]GIH14382.1 ABC transporter substrate-binding protein [Rugosimonospora africana]
MRRRIAVAAALAATLLGAAACGGKSASSSDSLDGKGKTLKVWLMVDAQTGWPGVVDAANAKFKADTGANVTIEYQQWTNHLTKLDATLAGKDVPDVIELGNTEAAKYVFNGGLADITAKKSGFDNSANWLTGLSAPCESDGKLYCVPYYAGARVLIYRTDMFSAAGLQPPKTYEDLVADAQKLKSQHASDPKFSAFYMPGAYWYAAMSWVYGSGGQIAQKGSDGKWKGTLEDPAAEAGLQKWADLAKQYSKGDPTKNESDQDPVFAQGDSAMLYGNGWELGAVQSQHKDANDPNSPMVDTAVKGKVAAVPLPGFSDGKSLPSFLGGSIVGVAQKSKNQGLAAEWIKDFTSTSSQQALLAKGALPNATNLLDAAAAVAGNEASATAAKSSWFTPNAPTWADVEKGNILQQALVDIVTGKKSVDDAAKAADEQITSALNAS